MTKFKIFASVILSSIAFMIEYPPEIITSNIGKWLVFFGIEPSSIPTWIHSSIFHNIVLLFCIVLLSCIFFSETMWKKYWFNKTDITQPAKPKQQLDNSPLSKFLKDASKNRKEFEKRSNEIAKNISRKE
jgi:hypothetical protein